MQFYISISRYYTAIIFLVMILLYSISCNEANEDRSATAIIKKATVTIHLQPFKGIAANDVLYIFNELKKVYPNIVLNKTIELPSSAFYPPRNRYRADSIIRYLSLHTAKGHITIGLTNKDISTTKNEIKDFGVMGLGFQPGNACVASTFRLSKQNNLEQFFKVAIHELGHTQDLPHCEVKTCFMRDAEGRNSTNDEKEFCGRCKNKLQKKCWIL